jgi:NAD binding domain of 6-phosphogluconate dehydrogenase
MNPSTSEKNKLGFLGVGYMGRPIVQRLLESGFKVATYDRDRSKAEELIRYGGTVAESVAQLPPLVMSCCRAFRPMKLFWTFTKGRMARQTVGAEGPVSWFVLSCLISCIAVLRGIWQCSYPSVPGGPIVH